MSYDVFISFKNSGKDGKATPDATAARGVYDALKSAGMKVFFSEESLAEVGKGHFGKSIETALESARVLILVASCREHIESPWVETEWDSFLQNIRSGNKQGELFIFNCGDLKPTDLPLFLRRQQMFANNSMDKLLQFVASAVPTLPILGDYVHAALHCYRPEKNEDKVYLVTVHPGTTSSTCHVTAHWGARSAKRLSSQIKAVNVSKEAAHIEVEKAKQEKLRGGYLPAAYAKLLTDEARALLTASLGLFETAPTPKAPAKGKTVVKKKILAINALPVAEIKPKPTRVKPAPVQVIKTDPVKEKKQAVKLAPKGTPSKKAPSPVKEVVNVSTPPVKSAKTVAKDISKVSAPLKVKKSEKASALPVKTIKPMKAIAVVAAKKVSVVSVPVLIPLATKKMPTKAVVVKPIPASKLKAVEKKPAKVSPISPASSISAPAVKTSSRRR